MGHFGSFSVILGHFGSFWVFLSFYIKILDFDLFCSKNSTSDGHPTGSHIELFCVILSRFGLFLVYFTLNFIFLENSWLCISYSCTDHICPVLVRFQSVFGPFLVRFL